MMGSLVKCNLEIYQSALEFLNIAESAESHAIEISGFCFAYKANLAFSIELFLKCIEAISTEKIVLEVGDAKITRLFSESSIRGHNLNEIFDKLAQDKKHILNKNFENHRCNIAHNTLEDTLTGISDAFTKNRYAFESGKFTSSDSDILLWTARFFKEVLAQE